MSDADARPDRSLFAGGGRVGADMARVDWSATPVGEPDTWPAALRTTVRMLLTSRFSMWMAWGPQLTVFYNDAYWRDTLRAKHPWALGRPAHEVWGEVWDAAGPRIASVLETGVATWDEDLLLFLERSGYPEETYHTFSYSPLANEDGTVHGMLCVVTENTERVIGDRRMATLRDLASATGASRSRADALFAAAATLEANGHDVPFAQFYVRDEEGGPLRPAVGVRTSPMPADAWPLHRVAGGVPAVVDDLATRFGPDLPRGAWAIPPEQAVLLPLAGHADEGPAAAGVLVVGLNPHRPLNERQWSFLHLLAAQIAAGTAHAGGYEAEQRRAEALAELDRAKTEFFSNVSHEFRTPLTLIMGPVEEMRADPQADPAHWSTELDVVHRNAQRLGRLVNSLLDFSRLQSGRLEARYVPTELGAATAELAGVFRSAVERAGLEYVVDCPPLDEPVLLDRDAWEKVVLNLLSNALKFTFTGRIEVHVRAGDEAAVLEVSDTGVGVPEPELPRLFERFHRVDGMRSRSGEGSGIGLALARELVALHGGEISATSAVGVGTTMTVTIPFGRAHLPADRIAAAPTDSPDSPVSPDSPDTVRSAAVEEALSWLPETGSTVAADPEPEREPGDGRVLVADDNADMRAYLQRLLAGRYEVRVAADGEEALRAATTDPPDLVLSDVMMPRRGGLELLAALRGDERTARIPVLLLSARAGPEAAVEGLAAQADDYLVKPFTAPELLARVDAHLRLGRARRRAEARFTAMADLAPAMIWAADPDGARVFHNEGWRRFTGRSDAADLGTGWTAGLHPDDRTRYAETTAAAIAQGVGWEVEYRLRRFDGAHHWVVEQAAPLSGGSGVSGWVGSCVDVNARWVEAERQRLLGRVGAELDSAADVADGLERLARLLVAVRFGDRVVVHPVDGDAFAGEEVPVGGFAGGLAAAPAGNRTGDGGDRDADGVSVTAVPARATDAAERVALAGRSPTTVAHSAPPRLHLPLVARERPLALLTLERGPAYTDDDRDVLAEIAGRAALALDNVALLADERAAAERLALLQRATAELSAAATPAEVGRVTVDHLQSLFGPTTRLGVFEHEPEGRELVPLDGRNVESLGAVPVGREVPRLVSVAVDQGEPVWLVDGAARPDEDPVSAALRDRMTEIGVRGAMGLPLIVAGRTVGALGVGLRDRDRISEAERHTLMALAEPCAMALDRARLYRAEHRIADTLQRSLLPQAVPAVERLALAVRYLPGATGTQAGGDWYDVAPLEAHRVAIAVGDVVGQGTAAAAVMGQLRIALTGYLLAGHGPAEALGLLDALTARIPGARASTAMCLTLDTVRGELRWARAGHLPALLVDAAGVRVLDDPAGHGPLLGLPPDRRDHGEAVAELAPGAVLVLYTDGLVERRGENLDDGLERLTAALERHRDAAPEEMATAVLDELGPHSDDVALVVARLLPPPLELALPAEAGSLALVRRRVAAWARAAGLSEDTLDDLQLALGEAATNAVEHAYIDATRAGRVKIRVRHRGDGTIEADVRDRGRWRPVPTEPGYRGRGLTLVRNLTEGAEVLDRRRGGTRVRFRIRETPAPAAPDSPRGSTTEPPDVPPVGTPATLRVDGERLALRGDLDLAAVDACREGLFAAVDEVISVGGRPVLDLRGVGYLASAGVGMLLEALARASGAASLETLPGSAADRALGLALPGDAR